MPGSEEQRTDYTPQVNKAVEDALRAEMHRLEQRLAAGGQGRPWRSGDPVLLYGKPYRWRLGKNLQHHLDAAGEIERGTPIQVLQAWTESPCAAWNQAQAKKAAEAARIEE
jgi:hypothetical protein